MRPRVRISHLASSDRAARIADSSVQGSSPRRAPLALRFVDRHRPTTWTEGVRIRTHARTPVTGSQALTAAPFALPPTPTPAAVCVRAHPCAARHSAPISFRDTHQPLYSDLSPVRAQTTAPSYGVQRAAASTRRAAASAFLGGGQDASRPRPDEVLVMCTMHNC